jgi:hypothetical protein
MMDRHNKMLVTDVNFQTRVDIETWKPVRTWVSKLDRPPTKASVSALKDCGCDGPWLGNLEAVPYSDWPKEFKNQRPRKPGKLWAILPVKQGNNYYVVKKPVGYAMGKRQAAYALRDFIAKRNGHVDLREAA